MRPSPMRNFDPRRVAALECRAWVAYYRRAWPAVLLAAVGLVRPTSPGGRRALLVRSYATLLSVVHRQSS
ncbi:MAG: hypothetical protein ACR2LJ_07575 [Acidimicrobiales bacterium]